MTQKLLKLSLAALPGMLLAAPAYADSIDPCYPDGGSIPENTCFADAVPTEGTPNPLAFWARYESPSQFIFVDEFGDPDDGTGRWREYGVRYPGTPNRFTLTGTICQSDGAGGVDTNECYYVNISGTEADCTSTSMAWNEADTGWNTNADVVGHPDYGKCFGKETKLVPDSVDRAEDWRYYQIDSSCDHPTSTASTNHMTCDSYAVRVSGPNWAQDPCTAAGAQAVIDGQALHCNHVEGAYSRIEHRGPAVQVGLAASGKNATNFGVASWITTVRAAGDSTSARFQDFNIDLELETSPPDVPELDAGVTGRVGLFGLLAGLLMLGRRRRRA